MPIRLAAKATDGIDDERLQSSDTAVNLEQHALVQLNAWHCGVLFKVLKLGKSFFFFWWSLEVEQFVVLVLRLGDAEFLVQLKKQSYVCFLGSLWEKWLTCTRTIKLTFVLSAARIFEHDKIH